MNQKPYIDLSRYVITIAPISLVIMMLTIHCFNDFMLKIQAWAVVAIMLSLVLSLTVLLYLVQLLINKFRK